MRGGYNEWKNSFKTILPADNDDWDGDYKKD